MEFQLTIDGEDYSVTMERGSEGFEVKIGGQSESVDAAFADSNTVSLFFGERAVTVHIAFDGEKVYASVDGVKFEMEKNRAASPAERLHGRGGPLQAETVISTPMPGQIVKIQVEEGEIVEPGQNLFIVESMKMENQIKSSIKARVEKVHFGDGDPVEANAPIVELSLIPDEP
jgi:biotin carboxyl carrier protein